MTKELSAANTGRRGFKTYVLCAAVTLKEVTVMLDNVKNLGLASETCGKIAIASWLQRGRDSTCLIASGPFSLLLFNNFVLNEDNLFLFRFHVLVWDTCERKAGTVHPRILNALPCSLSAFWLARLLRVKLTLPFWEISSRTPLREPHLRKMAQKKTSIVRSTDLFEIWNIRDYSHKFLNDF